MDHKVFGIVVNGLILVVSTCTSRSTGGATASSPSPVVHDTTVHSVVVTVEQRDDVVLRFCNRQYDSKVQLQAYSTKREKWVDVLVVERLTRATSPPRGHRGPQTTGRRFAPIRRLVNRLSTSAERTSGETSGRSEELSQNPDDLLEWRRKDLQPKYIKVETPDDPSDDETNGWFNLGLADHGDWLRRKFLPVRIQNDFQCMYHHSAQQTTPGAARGHQPQSENIWQPLAGIFFDRSTPLREVARALVDRLEHQQHGGAHGIVHPEGFYLHGNPRPVGVPVGGPRSNIALNYDKDELYLRVDKKAPNGGALNVWSDHDGRHGDRLLEEFVIRAPEYPFGAAVFIVSRPAPVSDWRDRARSWFMQDPLHSRDKLFSDNPLHSVSDLVFDYFLRFCVFNRTYRRITNDPRGKIVRLLWCRQQHSVGGGARMCLPSLKKCTYWYCVI